MGDDFSNRQCYAGELSPNTTRRRLIQTVVDTLRADGYSTVEAESEATRSLVIGPPGRWIFVGDTAGGAETPSPAEFASLSDALSTVAPTIDILMSDSAAVHIQLHKDGALVDKYGNAAFPFFQFPSPEEAAEFEGKPELWGEFLAENYSIDDLRAAWVQDWGADEILSSTAELLGWDNQLACIGYTLDSEGLGIKYDQVLKLQNLIEFTEMHFRR